jgi:hypothetical protein
MRTKVAVSSVNDGGRKLVEEFTPSCVTRLHYKQSINRFNTDEYLCLLQANTLVSNVIYRGLLSSYLSS